MVHCESCDKLACVHVTEMEECGPVERHFCEAHAEEYLGAGFHRDVLMPFNLSALSPQAYERLARVFEGVELAFHDRANPADLVPAVQGLIGLLSDEEACLRYLAASWLGTIGSAEALEALRRAKNDSNSHVREAAQKAIANIARK